MANTSILAAFERMWQHVTAAIGSKSDLNHNHNDLYYTEAEVDNKISTHKHDDLYDAKGSASSALSSAKSYSDGNLATAKSYTDGKIDAIVGEGASTTLDTIGEISAAIEDNQDMLTTLNNAIGNKVDKVSGKGLSTNDLTATLKSNYDTAYSHVSNKNNPHEVTLSQLGVTATSTELNYMDGVTSNVQTQLDNKAPAVGVAYIDENDNETVTLTVDLTEIANLIGGDA